MESRIHSLDNFVCGSSKVDGFLSFSKLVLGLFLLCMVIALPSGIMALFDGLPWTGQLETIVMVAILPFLLILEWRFLSLRLPIIFLGLLLIIKGALFFCGPSSGWIIKVHPNVPHEKLFELSPFQTVEGVLGNFSQRISNKKRSQYPNKQGDTWVKTYATLWNKKASGVLQKPWKKKLDFPLDWVLYSNTERCGISTIPCFDELNPIIEIEGILLLPKGEKFSLVARGVQEGSLSLINENGESIVYFPARNFQEANEQAHQLQKGGKWRVSGKLTYQGANWSLIPVMVDTNGKINSDLGGDFLWQDEQGASVSFYKGLALILDSGVILLMLAWFVWTTYSLTQKQVLNWPFAVFSLSAIVAPLLMAPFVVKGLQVFGLQDSTTISFLGFSIAITIIGYLIWLFWQKDFRNFQSDRVVPSVFLFFGLALLCFFASKWWPLLGQWVVWGAHNDWTYYQILARVIVVDGEWLNAGEKVFYMQPFYRYFVGIYHWLFGQSPFAQHMADVWCVLGATTLIASLAMKLRLSIGIVFASSVVYLMLNLLGGFRYHIGRGLTEHHAMLFMILAIWFLYDARKGSFFKVILAGFFGVIGYWIRQDHLIIIAMLVFFIIEPTHGTTKEVWRAYWEQIWTHWKRGVTYFGIVAFGTFLLCFRNWWVGGVFAPTTVHPSGYWSPIDATFDTSFFDKIWLMLTATHYPDFTISTFILLPGTVLGLVALFWRPKFAQDYPLAIGLSLIGLFMPFCILNNLGYPPRFSIHLLPITILSMAIFMNKFYPFIKNVTFERNSLKILTERLF